LLWSEFFVPLSAVIVGGGISVYAQWFVLKKQHQDWIAQQWWERKAHAYSQIIEALWHLLEYSREVEAEQDLRVQTGRSTKSIDAHRFDDNQAELKKLADIGAFVISPEIADALSQYLSATSPRKLDLDYMDLDEVIQIHIYETRKCLSTVRSAAARDLHITRT